MNSERFRKKGLSTFSILIQYINCLRTVVDGSGLGGKQLIAWAIVMCLVAVRARGCGCVCMAQPSPSLQALQLWPAEAAAAFLDFACLGKCFEKAVPPLC